MDEAEQARRAAPNPVSGGARSAFLPSLDFEQALS